MNYEMNELLPVVGRLVEKYTAFESTSVTYEKAEQFMEAVLYCIRETELAALQEERVSDAGSKDLPEKSSEEYEKQDAFTVYKIGLRCVEEKTKQAMDIYHEILPEFSSYGNACLHDDVIKGIPEFFKWYDIKFAPQDTILTLDYPVLKDISGLEGIDKIYVFLKCVRLEQKFLGKFPEEHVIRTLEKYNDSYQDMIENICEIVFTDVIAHVLVKKPLSEQDFSGMEYDRLQELFLKAALPDIKKMLMDAAEIFFANYYGYGKKDGHGSEEEHGIKGESRGNQGDREFLAEYLLGTIDGMAVRFKNAADNGVICRMV